ncbi:hypothetical protein V1520DRAFT_324370 [Lipomyces starkeyi]|uniref:Uncharacterized protein n=1 Tax=Lipomyces starkeyi NRRL Y-11557 TaxID=675824 RepID=A0A1E3Q7I4_LIPST|nr:hypothetical protein LIPSTDRAFT_62789 [Lipomyces starkeyi NRRL Y-11557]
MYVEEVRWDSGDIAVNLKTLRKFPITRKPTKNLKYLHVLETLNDFTAVESEVETNILVKLQQSKYETNNVQNGTLQKFVMAKAESRLKENLSETEEKQLGAHTFQNRGPYMARVIRGWANCWNKQDHCHHMAREHADTPVNTHSTESFEVRGEPKNKSLPTITAYLHNWLFSIGRHSKEVILMVMSEDISAVGDVRPENDCMQTSDESIQWGRLRGCDPT